MLLLGLKIIFPGVHLITLEFRYEISDQTHLLLLQSIRKRRLSNRSEWSSSTYYASVDRIDGEVGGLFDCGYNERTKA